MRESDYVYALSQVGTRPDMTLDVAGMLNSQPTIQSSHACGGVINTLAL